jgi:hypothetical protein
MFGSDLGATGTNFGVGSASEVEELNKALTAGYGRGGDMTDGAVGSPLRVESLEATLKVTTYSERNIVFWKDIPKLPAFNTVEEFNQLNSYGNSGGYFVPEGTAPQESDSTYARKTVQVKYVGSLRKVTHQMTLVRPAHGDVIALETMNGTREILRTVEESLFTGNSACIAQEWDGFEKQFYDGIGVENDDQNIIDLRGEHLSEAALGDAARVIIDNYGFPTAMYLGYETMQDLNNLFLPKERISLNAANPGMAGFALQQFMTAGGAYAFRPSVFLKPGELAPEAGIGAAASLPSTSGVTAAAAAGASSGAASLIPAGTFKYAVVLENRFGKTAKIETANVTPTAGQQVTVTVSGLSGNTATSMRVYRSTGLAGTGPLKFMKRVPVAAGATATFVDKNFDLPGTSKAYLMQVDLDVMSFKQLAPFTKIPLATIDPSIRWMQLLYGTPALYAPRKMVVIKNVGKYTPV